MRELIDAESGRRRAAGNQLGRRSIARSSGGFHEIVSRYILVLVV